MTTLRTGVLREAAGESIGAGESRTEGAGAGGRGEAGGGRVGTTGESIGGGGGVRGRFPGPDLAARVLGAGILDSEFGTTLLITLVRDIQKTQSNNFLLSLVQEMKNLP